MEETPAILGGSRVSDFQTQKLGLPAAPATGPRAVAARRRLQALARPLVPWFIAPNPVPSQPRWFIALRSVGGATALVSPLRGAVKRMKPNRCNFSATHCSKRRLDRTGDIWLKWHLGKWNQKLKPAVCPSSLILSHTHNMD